MTRNATSMKQLRNTVRRIGCEPDVKFTQFSCRMETTSGMSTCHVINFFGNELIHDLLMNEAYANVRVDAERVETDPIIEPGRCVCVSEVKSGGWRILDSSLKRCRRLGTLENVGV